MGGDAVQSQHIRELSVARLFSKVSQAIDWCHPTGGERQVTGLHAHLYALLLPIRRFSQLGALDPLHPVRLLITAQQADMFCCCLGIMS